MGAIDISIISIKERITEYGQLCMILWTSFVFANVSVAACLVFVYQDKLGEVSLLLLAASNEQSTTSASRRLLIPCLKIMNL